MLVLGYALPLLAKKNCCFVSLQDSDPSVKRFVSLKEDMLNVLLIL